MGIKNITLAVRVIGIALAVLLTFSTFAGHINIALAYCSGYACDGTDPQGTSCNIPGGNVIDLAYGNTQLGDGFGELRYSPMCQTTWTRITNNSGATKYAETFIRRYNPNAQNGSSVGNLVNGGQWWSPQYYRPSGSSAYGSCWLTNTNDAWISGIK